MSAADSKQATIQREADFAATREAVVRGRSAHNEARVGPRRAEPLALSLRDLGDRAARAGYDFREIAENVAQGYPSPAAVTRGWMESRGHRRNILMRNAQDAGIGIAIGRGGDLHWVLKLGRD